mmetsp:Transcript_28654/g.25629  ORF Transcript_28654/g.25629 Transcript_28654/m.25629 type:complete len:114 (+) Transcript_28654:60-401(+)
MLSKSFKSFFNMTKVMAPQQFTYIPMNYFADAKAQEVSTKVDKAAKKRELSVYAEGQIVNRSQLVLKKQEDIEGYVKKLLSGYFRTTNRANLESESLLSDHGLDSLDVIELCM